MEQNPIKSKEESLPSYSDEWEKLDRYLHGELLTTETENERLGRFLDYLTDEERSVIRMRLQESLTLKEASKLMEISDTHIRQIQIKATGLLQKLVRINTAPFSKNDHGNFSEFLDVYFKEIRAPKTKLNLTSDEEVLLANIVQSGAHYWHPITEVLNKLASEFSVDPDQDGAAATARSLSVKLSPWLKLKR